MAAVDSGTAGLRVENGRQVGDTGRNIVNAVCAECQKCQSTVDYARRGRWG